MKIKLLKSMIFICIFVLSSTSISKTIELERDEIYTNNDFLKIDAVGTKFDDISKNLKPKISLKGASDEEEKQMLSTLFDLGESIRNVLWIYKTYPLNYKISDTNVKEVIIANLKQFRELLAVLQADERLLSQIQQVILKIENEDINAEKPDSTTLTLFTRLVTDQVPNFIENIYGVSYMTYYSFGVWTNAVLVTSEERLVYDDLIKKSKDESAKKEVLKYYTKQLKNLLELSTTYKSSVQELTKPAVSRNLENLQEIASEIKDNVDAVTAKRIYDYTMNVYYAVVSQN